MRLIRTCGLVNKNIESDAEQNVVAGLVHFVFDLARHL